MVQLKIIISVKSNLFILLLLSLTINLQFGIPSMRKPVLSLF